jgi:toxin ParE1/3/4
MLAIRLSPLAQADLDGIWQYTLTQWNEAQAEAYLLGLDASMKILAENPRLGRSLDDIRSGYFKYQSAQHLLIYRLTSEAIEFIRILHKSSDVERHV